MRDKKRMILFIVFISIIAFLLWKFIFSKEELIFNIKIDKKEITIGESINIDYEMNKQGTVKWDSSNSNVVKIDNNQIVGISVGSATIRGIVSTDNEEKEYDFIISVYHGNERVSIKDISVPDGELFITKGIDFLICSNPRLFKTNF